MKRRSFKVWQRYKFFGVNMIYKKLTTIDKEKLAGLIKEMNENLFNKAWFLPMESDLESVEKMINKSRFYILGAFSGSDLAGIASIDYKNGNLPNKYKFPEWCDINKMVEFSFSIVAMQYRGKGLTFKMLNKIKEIAILQGFEYACCTVHKDNYPSKKNLLKIGFKCYMSIQQDTDFPRELMLMKLK